LSSSPKNSSYFQGDFFGGCDLGQKRDHSVIAIIDKKGQEVYLRHLKRFKLGTEYGSILGYLKVLNERLQSLHRVLIDQTGVGEVFVEEAIKGGLKNAQGIMLSLPSKQQVMVYLKQLMQDGHVHIPFDQDFLNELHVERYELTKTGQIQFSHPEGTHDDRLWAFALAVYSSRPEIPQYHPVAVTGRVNKPRWQY
jgi:phage FluMu gp28-like protein